MSKVESRVIVGEHVINGRDIKIRRTTWHGTAKHNYDVVVPSAETVLTVNESFDSYPTREEMKEVLADFAPAEGRHDEAGAILLTDEQWRMVIDSEGYEDFEVDGFDDVEEVLCAARRVLGDNAPDSVKLPGIDRIVVYDTSDVATVDMLIMVYLPNGLHIASELIKVSSFKDTSLSGPDAARAVLNELIDYRNRLVADAEAAVSGPRFCRFCHHEVDSGGGRISIVEAGTNPWCCGNCWDPQLDGEKAARPQHRPSTPDHCPTSESEEINPGS